MNDSVATEKIRPSVQFKFDKQVSVPRDGSLEIDVEHRVAYVLNDVGSVLYMARIVSEVTVRG